MTQTIVQLVSRWHKTLYNSLLRWHSFVQHADFLTILLNSPTHWHKPLYNSPKHWHKILYNSPSRWHNFVKHTNILTILYNLSKQWHKTLYYTQSHWHSSVQHAFALTQNFVQLAVSLIQNTNRREDTISCNTAKFWQLCTTRLRAESSSNIYNI